MPRNQIELEQPLEYLSVLDENGELDSECDPNIDDELLQRMFRTMLLSRRFDEQLFTLQREGRIGTFAPVRGQEACQIGAMSALKDSDWFVPAFREFSAMHWRGFPLADVLLFIAGYNEGGAIPGDSHNLPISVPVATQLPHAVGIGYAIQQWESDDVAITFFGDGATSEGDFHEALNLAGVLQTPVIFLCQNNQWAISLPREKQSRSMTLAQKGLAYGLPCLQVDGNDVLAVHAAVAEAAKRARNGDGATMVECVTYRLSIHTTADDPSKYRNEEEVEKWAKRDPLPRFQNYLTGRELLSEDDVESMESEIKEEIEQAWKDTEKQIEELNGPEIMFDYVYAERPPYLEAQREAFEQRQQEG